MATTISTRTERVDAKKMPFSRKKRGRPVKQRNGSSLSDLELRRILKLCIVHEQQAVAFDLPDDALVKMWTAIRRAVMSYERDARKRARHRMASIVATALSPIYRRVLKSGRWLPEHRVSLMTTLQDLGLSNAEAKSFQIEIVTIKNNKPTMAAKKTAIAFFDRDARAASIRSIEERSQADGSTHTITAADYDAFIKRRLMRPEVETSDRPDLDALRTIKRRLQTTLIERPFVHDLVDDQLAMIAFAETNVVKGHEA